MFFWADLSSSCSAAVLACVGVGCVALVGYQQRDARRGCCGRGRPPV